METLEIALDENSNKIVVLPDIIFPINRILTGMRWRSIWNALSGNLWK